jgi:hypothetical protein
MPTGLARPRALVRPLRLDGQCVFPVILRAGTGTGKRRIHADKTSHLRTARHISVERVVDRELGHFLDVHVPCVVANLFQDVVLERPHFPVRRRVVPRVIVDEVCGNASPRAELSGVVGSSNAPPGEDASEATVLFCAGVHCCASTSSRSAKRAVIDRVGRSTISIPWQRSSSSIHFGIRISIPLGRATCTWCSPKEEHFRILVTVTP